MNTYTVTRPIMTRAELSRHTVNTYGRDYQLSDDGYNDMEVESANGWRPIVGWDLGDWPYVVISTREATKRHHYDERGDYPAFELLVTVEDDRTTYRFATREDRDAAVDYLFVWYGLARGYPDRFRGPYRTTV